MRELDAALHDLDVAAVEDIGRRCAGVLGRGGRLLAAGNGGSAAQAQHLAGELVGRFRSERRPLSAIALHAETSSLTAIANDYGLEEMFARQLVAHARPGDIAVLLSTSGSSVNLLCAAQRAPRLRVTTVAFTGAAPNPLASLAELTVAVASHDTTVVQEVHLVAIHLLCAAIDDALAAGREPSSVTVGRLEAVGKW
jgi:D-sedoheptulose 7-phosphate isomerase